jgi:hypothetical protein
MAAVPFTLPHWTNSPPTWADLAAVFQSAAAELQKLQVLETSARAKQLVIHLQASDPPKIAEANAQHAGAATTRRKFDRVREILDWAAGAGNPRHSGDSPQIPGDWQGRFWNLPLADFKQCIVQGVNIVESIDGEPPLLIEALTRQIDRMPRGRTALTGERLQFIIDWVNAGCPDEPLAP